MTAVKRLQKGQTEGKEKVLFILISRKVDVDKRLSKQKKKNKSEERVKKRVGHVLGVKCSGAGDFSESTHLHRAPVNLKLHLLRFFSS